MLTEAVMSDRTPVGTIKPDSRDVSLFASPDIRQKVSVGDSLTISAWWAGICLVSNAMASMPLEVWRKNKAGGEDLADQHPVHHCLTVSNNGWQVPSTFKSLAQGSLFLSGNFCADASRNVYGQVEKLTAWLPQYTHFGVDGSNEPMYGVTGVIPQVGVVIPTTGRNMTVTPQWLPHSEFVHLKNFSTDGYLGLSTLHAARAGLSQSLAQQRFGQRMFEKGRPAGFFTKDGNLSKEQREVLKDEWKEMNEGPLNAFNVGILANGIDWKSMGYTADDAQYLQNLQHGVREVARWLQIPVPLLGDMTNSSDGKIVELMLYFLQHTIVPWIVRWEEELNLKLFTPRERPKYKARFDIKAFLRGDILTTAKVNEMNVRNGLETIDDIRRENHKNPYEDGSGSKPLIIASQLDTLANVASGKSVLTKKEGVPSA